MYSRSLSSPQKAILLLFCTLVKSVASSYFLYFRKEKFAQFIGKYLVTSGKKTFTIKDLSL